MRGHNKYKNLETKGLITKIFLIKEYLINNRSATNIAKQIKCEHQTILHYLRKYNIDIRPKEIACKGIKHGIMKLIHKTNLSNSKIYRFKKYHEKEIEYYNKKWNKISKEQWSWLAGFYEGEGCLYIRTRQFSKNLEGFISITQKEKYNLSYIKDLLGIGTIYKQIYDSTYVHKYSLHKGDAVKVFLYKILPYIKSPIKLKQIKKLEIK